MTDKRVVCLTCSKKLGKIVRYVCEYNGYNIPYTDHGLQATDMWKCPECGHEILDGFGEPDWCLNYEGDSWKKYLHEDMKEIKG